MPESIEWVRTNADTIAAWVTFAMLSLVGGAHALLGLARGCVWVATRTANPDDDRFAVSFLRTAEKIDRFVGKLAALHARLMPRPLNPTPSLERVEAYVTASSRSRSKEEP